MFVMLRNHQQTHFMHGSSVSTADVIHFEDIDPRKHESEPQDRTGNDIEVCVHISGQLQKDRSSAKGKRSQ